jgi:AraC-like DNA-binding protein
MMRQERCAVAVLRSRGIAIDYGVITHAVAFRARGQRSQLAIFLAGRGYLTAAGRVLCLHAGDVVECDQRDLDAEGYGGSPCEVIIVDWESAGVFGASCPRAPRTSRLRPGDIARLRALVARLDTTPAAHWFVELCTDLRALGVCVERGLDPRGVPRAPAALARTYGELGGALSRMHEQPSLSELAETLQLSERHVHRRMTELARSYAHPFQGWRDFLHEMRLEWATHLLSIPGAPLPRVARLAGYRSTEALHHAFSARGVEPPSAIARRLAAHWA